LNIKKTRLRNGTMYLRYSSFKMLHETVVEKQIDLFKRLNIIDDNGRKQQQVQSTSKIGVNFNKL